MAEHSMVPIWKFILTSFHHQLMGVHIREIVEIETQLLKAVRFINCIQQCQKYFAFGIR